jgi:EAL domain-containing protein (putative c-di-GMP-specific phosphodiesterase class I)
MESSTQNRVRLLTELRSALNQGKGLELHYQPQVASDSHALVGCEALIRWVKASGEAISPDVFIPLAEYTGMIVDIGDWVLREACRQIVRWDALGCRVFGWESTFLPLSSASPILWRKQPGSFWRAELPRPD